MANWKKGTLHQENNGYWIVDDRGMRLNMKSKLIKNRFPQVVNAMGGESQFDVFLEFEGKELKSLAVEKPAGFSEQPKPAAAPPKAEIPAAAAATNAAVPAPAPEDDEEDESENKLVFDMISDSGAKADAAKPGAFAPYNFVNLPQAPVLSDLGTTAKTWSGELTIELKNTEPLFIRDGALGEEKNNTFFHLDSENNPVLPGTSLKGVLRAMIESVTGNGYDRVSDRYFYFREMRGGNKYVGLFLNANQGEYLVKAGFLRKEGSQWYIEPAEWAKVSRHELAVIPAIRYSDASKLQNDKQAREDFKNRTGKSIRFSQMISGQIQVGPRRLNFPLVSGYGNGNREGWLVLTGPMGPKKHEFVFHSREPRSNWIPVQKKVVDVWEQDEEYVPSGFGKKLPADKIYFCHRLFGATDVYQGGKRKEMGMTGRVSVSYGKYLGRAEGADIIFKQAQYESEQARALRPLNSPKPSSYQLYLKQTEGTPLADFFSEPRQNQISGHKFYWHQPGNDIFNTDRNINQNILSHARPLSPGHVFQATVAFTELRKEELGALLWVVSLDEKYAWKIGAGKPLGMGSTKVRLAGMNIVADGAERYRSLDFSAKPAVVDANEFVSEFKTFAGGQMGGGFDGLPHVRDFYALHDYSLKDKKTEDKDYMHLQNEPGRSGWRHRKILPAARDFYSAPDARSLMGNDGGRSGGGNRNYNNRGGNNNRNNNNRGGGGFRRP